MSVQIPKNIPQKVLSPAGIYIHIPFCRSKCPYCDFYSIASSSLIPRWLESLKRELIFYSGKFGAFDTVYLGGGTPSILDVSTIEEILTNIKNNCNVVDQAEITIEANPRDLDSDKIAGLKSTGINRINLGVQSFNDKDLRFLGRHHTGEDCEKLLIDLRDAGFENIGIDFIYGLMNQTFEEWYQVLKKAVCFSPQHISCYQLTVEGKTVFNAMKTKGELKELSEDTACRFFLETSEFLEHGYIHYEISNFSKSPQHRSRHNRKYWARVPYLGLGPSAHSFDGEKRWWNYRSVKKYCVSLENNNMPVESSEILTAEQTILEKISLGLRTAEGISTDDLSDIPGVDERIAKLNSLGHIRISGNRIMPTKKGFLVSDRLPLFILDL